MQRSDFRWRLCTSFRQQVNSDESYVTGENTLNLHFVGAILTEGHQAKPKRLRRQGSKS